MDLVDLLFLCCFLVFICPKYLVDTNCKILKEMNQKRTFDFSTPLQMILFSLHIKDYFFPTAMSIVHVFLQI